jgi:broad-specificity NMP kinase
MSKEENYYVIKGIIAGAPGTGKTSFQNQVNSENNSNKGKIDRVITKTFKNIAGKSMI